MVRCHIECERAMLACATVLELTYSGPHAGQNPPSPRISVHSALPALLGTLISCKILEILSSVPFMGGFKNQDSQPRAKRQAITQEIHRHVRQ